MKNVIVRMSMLWAIAMAFVGCSEYDNGFTDKEIKFRTDFEREIGSYDAQQDWNLAQRANVNVITSTSRPVKVYSQIGDSYKLVGDFRQVYGEQSLSVDVEKGTEYLVVSDGDHALRTYVNGTVSFDDLTSWSGDVRETRTVVVQKWDSEFLTPEDMTQAEKDRVIAEFNKYSTDKNEIILPWKNMFIQQIGGRANAYNIDVYNNDGHTSHYPDGYYTLYDHIKNFTQGREVEKGNVLVKDIDSEGVEPLTQFVFNNNNRTYIIREIDGNYYLGFDNSVGGSGYYNYFIFRLTEAKSIHATQEEVKDAEKQAWIVAAEDLGGGFDIDYNDVVFKVEHVSGQTTATVTPLAAGGTLASYIFYKDPVNGMDTSLGEIHKMLGGGVAKSGQYQPINVGDQATVRGNSETINVRSDFSMALDEKEVYAGNNMGDFSIRVLPQGADPNAVESDGVTKVNPPTQGSAPYMLCVPFSYQKDGKTHVWAWPKEMIRLSNAYSYFAKWKNDHSTYQDWFQTPNAGQTVNTSMFE